MRAYSNIISLIKNSRGVYCLDTSIGCTSGMQTAGGCYNDCYAARSAKTYGYDFSTTILRYFASKKHQNEIVVAISKIKMPFIRIGCSGDPSENWEHCLSILDKIKYCNKEIVIITRHWTLLTDKQLRYLSTINVCINTSVSALDNDPQRQVQQYNRLKPYCKSVLRIVSCDFNLLNKKGLQLSILQKSLFSNENTIDTIFRPSKNNALVTGGVINITTGVFNGHKATISKFNRKTYTGKCANCLEMCGQQLQPDHKINIHIVKQLQLL